MPTAPPPVAQPLEAPIDVAAEPVVRPGAQADHRADDKKKRKRQPPYAVVLHNDALNTMDFVVGALRKVFGYDADRAQQLMLRAHVGGKARVWTGTRELAELKADQLKSCGADPVMKLFGARPLKVSVEPVEEE